MPENKRILSALAWSSLSLDGGAHCLLGGRCFAKGPPSARRMHHEERDGDVFKTDAPLPSILSHCQREIVLGARDAMMTTQKRKMIVCPVLAHARDGAR